MRAAPPCVSREIRYVTLARHERSDHADDVFARRLRCVARGIRRVWAERLRDVNRVVDVALAGTALVVASPLLGLAAVVVKLEDGGQVLYRQERVGKDGQPFELLKLRTMVTGAEQQGAGFAVDRGDPRITRAGRVLRRLSLDELPQL